MAVDLTQDAENANRQTSKTPNIVVKFDGITKCYGAVIISKILQYGDPFDYGDPGLVYGGLVPVNEQSDIITLSGGTTTTITQNVDVDKGRGDSIQSMQIVMIDKDGEVTELIQPGNQVTDLLGNRATVYFGFSNTAFPEDYIVLFRGNVDQIDARSSGSVAMNIIHPDKKKKANLFTKTQSTLSAGIDATQVTIPLDDASEFLEPVVGPDGSTIDDTIKYYARIAENEIVRYTGISGNTLTGVTRGQLGTVGAVASSGGTVDSLITLNGNVLSDISLKLMLSGKDGPYETGVDIENFENIVTGTVNNSIYFSGIDIATELGVTEGDFITTTGATEGANNIGPSAITLIQSTDLGSYLTVADNLTEEIGTGATASFRSQYDTWGSGRGMAMNPVEVDIQQHLDIFNTFLPIFDTLYYIKDSVENAKEFLELDVYRPAGCFSLVRKAKASVGIHTPPLPGAAIPTIDNTNVQKPAGVALRRSLSKNFYNGVVYKLDDKVDEDRFLTTVGTIDGDSITRFGDEVPSSFLVIEAKGMRTASLGKENATTASNRRLKTYRFGAEFISGLKVILESGLSVEAGDVVLLDIASLNLPDIQTGTRSGEPRLFRVDQKKFNIKTGEVTIDVVDTNFDKDVRYGLIGPSSFVKSGNSQTEFIIKPSFNTAVFGDNEFRKWQDYVGVSVVVRNTDFSVIGTSVLEDVVGNTIRVSTALGFTPLEDYIMEFAPYDVQPDNDAVDRLKLIYASITDDENDFGDGKPAYRLF